MNYTVTRLDRRYLHWEEFNYVIEFHKNREWSQGTGVLDFDQARKWFNATYGWSQEVETRIEMIKSKVRMNIDVHDFSYINTDWAYSCRYQEYRIYVSDSALTMFELRWRQHVPA
jgi:hypothetical protein